jgi:hypothetical protein
MEGQVASDYLAWAGVMRGCREAVPSIASMRTLELVASAILHIRRALPLSVGIGADGTHKSIVSSSSER